MNDKELREALQDIDENEDVDVTPWEAEFIDGIVFSTFQLSEKQRDIAERIIQDYEI